VADQAAAQVPGRYRPPLDNASPQRPVRRVLRVKTVEALPRPMTAETYAALLGQLRSRRDRALLEVMWEGGLRPGEVLGLQLEDLSYGRRRSPSASAIITRGGCGRSRAGTGSWTCWKGAPCPR
jgi:integrase/recombinase XerD